MADCLQLLSFFVAFLAISIASILFYLEYTPSENEERNFAMAAAASDDEVVESFRAKNMSAFVVGFTGETGKALVRELLQRKVFQKVILIGRRKVEYQDELYKDVEQRIIDFDNMNDYSEAFKGIDVGYCCLGTTRAKSGVEGFKRVDFDYVVKSAELAKEGGCQHFNLVSSTGANKNSFFLYQMVKGESEEAVTNMMFKRLTIYRPGLLLCKREEMRLTEKVAQCFMAPIARLAPTTGSVPTTTVAKAMVNAALSEDGHPVQILNNKDIHRVAGPTKKK